nr:MAG TPA: hypothetical protein [Caudoviricetes sp.]
MQRRLYQSPITRAVTVSSAISLHPTLLTSTFLCVFDSRLAFK